MDVSQTKGASKCPYKGGSATRGGEFNLHASSALFLHTKKFYSINLSQ